MANGEKIPTFKDLSPGQQARYKGWARGYVAGTGGNQPTVKKWIELGRPKRFKLR